MIPKDPVLLLSFVNMRLRDVYNNLDALCEDLDVERKEIETALNAIGYDYKEEQNQFK